MLKLFKRKKPKEIIINLAELNPLKEELEADLKIYNIPEKSRKKIHEVLTDTAKFGLNLHDKPEIVYFSVKKIAAQRSPEY